MWRNADVLGLLGFLSKVIGPELCHGLIELSFIMCDFHSGWHFDDIYKVVPQFDEFPWNHVGLIDHFLNDLILDSTLVLFVDLLLPIIALGYFIIFEESQLTRMDQYLLVILLFFVRDGSEEESCVLLMKVMVMLFYSFDYEILNGLQNDWISRHIQLTSYGS